MSTFRYIIFRFDSYEILYKSTVSFSKRAAKSGFNLIFLHVIRDEILKNISSHFLIYLKLFEIMYLSYSYSYSIYEQILYFVWECSVLVAIFLNFEINRIISLLCESFQNKSNYSLKWERIDTDLFQVYGFLLILNMDQEYHQNCRLSL